MLAFAIVCAAYAALVSIQNLVLSRRLEHWRGLYLVLRQDFAALVQIRESFDGLRLVGKARGGTPPKGDAA